MRKSKNTKVSKLYGRKKLITSLTLIFGVIVAIIILLSYYGQNVGSFTVKLDDDLSERKIYLSLDENFETKMARLEADSLDEATTVDLSRVHKNIARNTVGTTIGNNRSYLSYTFYMKNESTEAVDITETLKITKVKENLDDVSWIWYFSDQDDTEGMMYHKENTEPPIDEKVAKNYPDVTTNFLDSDTVFTRDRMAVNPGEVRRITIITWIDANDPDIRNYDRAGAIRFTLTFTLYKEDNKR